ncbi:hypothetical protein DEJ51_19685 [Streptomyces venezuelae]|uniref:Uncharacterized protein n=1 Tax=Streptomyces venezuelae TaxID=54571 RepID=A0A5P2DM39_STRVZ|nr:hypothetical protein DEJ51_19685 [Streptomyces venezuelae]
MTDRPAPEKRKTAGKPPEERAGPSGQGRGGRRCPAWSGAGTTERRARPDPGPGVVPGRRTRSLRASHGSASDDRLGLGIGRPRAPRASRRPRPTTVWGWT